MDFLDPYSLHSRREHARRAHARAMADQLAHVERLPDTDCATLDAAAPLLRGILRAAIYRNYGDEGGEAREMSAVLRAAGCALGLCPCEVDRLTMPAPMNLGRFNPPSPN